MADAAAPTFNFSVIGAPRVGKTWLLRRAADPAEPPALCDPPGAEHVPTGAGVVEAAARTLPLAADGPRATLRLAAPPPDAETVGGGRIPEDFAAASAGVVLCFAADDPDSLTEVGRRIEPIARQIACRGGVKGAEVPMMSHVLLCATKADLFDAAAGRDAACPGDGPYQHIPPPPAPKGPGAPEECDSYGAAGSPAAGGSVVYDAAAVRRVQAAGQELARRYGVPLVETSALRGTGLDELWRRSAECVAAQLEAGGAPPDGNTKKRRWKQFLGL